MPFPLQRRHSFCTCCTKPLPTSRRSITKPLPCQCRRRVSHGHAATHRPVQSSQPRRATPAPQTQRSLTRSAGVSLTSQRVHLVTLPPAAPVPRHAEHKICFRIRTCIIKMHSEGSRHRRPSQRAGRGRSHARGGAAERPSGVRKKNVAGIAAASPPWCRPCRPPVALPPRAS